MPLVGGLSLCQVHGPGQVVKGGSEIRSCLKLGAGVTIAGLVGFLAAALVAAFHGTAYPNWPTLLLALPLLPGFLLVNAVTPLRDCATLLGLVAAFVPILAIDVFLYSALAMALRRHRGNSREGLQQK